MANCVSFYNAAGSLDVYSMFHRISSLDSGKVWNELSPPLVSNIFTQKSSHPYNVRLNSQFSRPLVRSVFHGTESISYLNPVTWDILPDSYKNLPNLSVFKNRIKKMET